MCWAQGFRYRFSSRWTHPIVQNSQDSHWICRAHVYTCISLHNPHQNAARDQASPWQTCLLFGTTLHFFVLVFLAYLYENQRAPFFEAFSVCWHFIYKHRQHYIKFMTPVFSLLPRLDTGLQGKCWRLLYIFGTVILIWESHHSDIDHKTQY